MDYTSLVLSQCRNINYKIPEARVMKDRCRQLGQKLTSVEEMVLALQNRPSGSITSQVGGALQRLYTTLMSADSLVQKCTMHRVVNKVKYKSEFNALDRMIQDSLRVLATIPHVSHAPRTNQVPSTSRYQSALGYTVEEVDDDSDDDVGVLVPFALGGTVALAQNPFAMPQANLEFESVVLVENGLLVYAERLTGHF
ncbi:hypothetical protein NL108_012348 [Boleophthalmus pectinirostris]|nr:hypothetical protein NL108_012348 [Boleophthalmus pectinirostris]